MDPKLLEVFKGIKVLIGLKQQGHMPTVEAMLTDNKTWDEIGKAIGWDGRAAKEWYEIETQERITNGLLERD